jgi:hypothetical protein
MRTGCALAIQAPCLSVNDYLTMVCRLQPATSTVVAVELLRYGSDMPQPICVAWCLGGFFEGARVVVDFDISAIGAVRQVTDVTLRKFDSLAGVRRPAVPQSGQYLDQALWSIFDTDGCQAKAVWGRKAH